MASMQDRLKLKRELCDTWSTREQLCLASSVLKSGDQNWNSVSKSLKPFVEKEALRPADWFSPKSCAIQYATLVENADTPKRKKRENNDITGVTTIGTAIVRQLTAERISEIRQIIAFQRDEYQQLKQEINLLKSGSISDEKLKKMWQVIEQEDREAEQKERAHSAWLAKRQQKQESSARETANLSTPKKTLEIPCEPVDVSDDTQETEDDKKNQGGRSPLLTSLLKSPSPTTQVLNATSTAQTTSPTIASLLGATTKPQTSHVAQNLTSQLNQIVVKSISSPMPSITSLTSMSVASSASGKEERPSVGAPTLSMMLQLPSNIPRSLPSQLNNNSAPTTPVVSSAPLKNVKTNVNETVTRSVSVPVTPVVDNSPVQVIEPAVADVTDTETIDKDEINEIIDDIEELIKEEISPEVKAASVSIVKTIEEEKKEEPIVHTVNEEKIQNLNESESPDLDSSKNDITMELIEQDTSKIAEIIGASPEIQAPSPLVEPEKPIEIEIESVEEKKEEEEEKKSSPPVVTIKEEVEDISTDKRDKEIKTEIIVEENIVPEEKVEEIPEVVEKNKEKESTNDGVVEKDTTEEILVEKDVVNEEKEIEEKEQEQKDEKEQEKDDEKEQEKDVEKEKEGEEKQKDDKKVEEKGEIVEEPVEVEEPKKEEEKVEITIEPLLEVKETEVEEEKKEEQQQQQQDEIMEENIVEKISEKPKESNDVVEVEKSTEISSIVEDTESVQEIAKESEPCQDIKAECKEEKIEVDEKKDIVLETTVKLEVEKSKEPSIEVNVENNSNERIVKEAIIKEASVKEPSKTSSSPSTEDIKKEKKEIPKILDKPSEINSSPIPTKTKTTTTTPKISKPSEDKKVEIKIIKSVQEDQATDVEDKIPHSKIPIRMDINDDKKNDNNKTIEKIDKEIKIEDSIKKDIVKIKKQETPSVSSIDDIEEEESSMTKLSGRAIKTYSKKQNVSIDSEPETDTSEGADYRAWKKAIILVFNRLATHRFSSLFLKPITEENAPGYHSVVFRPMDLSTIKKNIDNGTIRSTTQFQRDVMLMFQNAIMYNKHDTRVHKMTLDMQEECLEQMQVLVEVAAEGPVRRETRTAANSSISEANDNNILKRKRSLITPSPLDSDSPRLKKRRKSEND